MFLVYNEFCDGSRKVRKHSLTGSYQTLNSQAREVLIVSNFGCEPKTLKQDCFLRGGSG